MTIKSRPMVRVRAYWGNSEADCVIRIPRSKWMAIQNGASFSKRTWSWYEGKRESVEWVFANGLLTVNGDGAAQYLVDEDVSELICEDA